MKRRTIMANQDALSFDPLSNFIESLQLVPVLFGHQVHSKNNIAVNRVSPQFELIYVIGGKSRITIRNNTFDCAAGDVILIPAFTRHCIVPDPVEPHDNFYIHFDLFPYYAQQGFLDSVRTLTHYGVKEAFTGLFRTWEQEAANPQNGSYSIYKALLKQILTEIMRRQRKVQLPAQKNSAIDLCIQFIEENVTKPISVSDLASFTGLSPATIYKLFRKILNMSPVHLIQMTKMKRAAELLHDPDHSVKEIALTLGFSSQYYFTKVFKQHFKMPPSEYIDTIYRIE